jgi:hypothetical protein
MKTQNELLTDLIDALEHFDPADDQTIRALVEAINAAR